MSREAPRASWKGPPESNIPVYRPSSAGPSIPAPVVPVTRQLVEEEEQEEEQIPQQDERPHTPPPYSGPTSSSMTVPPAPQPQPTYPGLPQLDYSLYSPSTFTLSPDATQISSYSRELSTYPTTLANLIKLLATVPPKPMVRIVGIENGGPRFDIKLNLMNLIVPERMEKGRMNYVKVIGPGEMGFRGANKVSTAPNLQSLEEWTRRYCEDSSLIKQFTLERTIINWDTNYLSGRLLSLIASTDYRGRVEVTYPLTHSHVVVHAPDKYNRFFSDITKVFTGTKKYEVVKAVWPYANVARGEVGRRCAVQDEDVWFESWKDAIRHAVVMRRSGFVTVEDRLEFLMEPKGAKTGE